MFPVLPRSLISSGMQSAGGAPGTPLTPIGQVWSRPPIAGKGWILSWLSPLWPPGLGTWLQAEVGCQRGSGREPRAEGGDPAVGRSLSSMRSWTRRNWARGSSICKSRRASRCPQTLLVVKTEKQECQLLRLRWWQSRIQGLDSTRVRFFMCPTAGPPVSRGSFRDALLGLGG